MSTPAAGVRPPSAGWGRRFVALMIDWVACTLVCILVLGGLDQWWRTPWSGWVTLGIFWLEASVGTAIAGGSFGQLAGRVRVLRTTGGGLTLPRAMLRTALICLVVPPLVFKSDGRGLHDLAVDSATYRL